MQAIILAAGFGKRLQPMTNTIPKCLIPVNGTPLIINALNNLSNRNISEVLIVTGHKHEMIRDVIGTVYQGMQITFIINKDYEKTNNVYSFYLAKEYIKEDVIMLECDLFYRRSLIDRILEGTAECNILVSKYNKDTMDGTVINADDTGNALMLYVNRHQRKDFNYKDLYKTVNIYTFSQQFALDVYMPAIELYVKSQSVNSYYELVLGSLIYFGNNQIQIIEIDEREWCEIDNVDDLKRAELMFT